jgi:hypothetical protein
MILTPILIRHSKMLVPPVTLLIMAGMLLAQNVPLVSPPLTIRPGTILAVRINEPLSSDHNRVGDVFSTTLTQPVIVQGIVVARYGQTAAGQVVEARKAGRASGVSRLGITLTSLPLVDGQNVPIQSQLLVRQGPTSVERDAVAVAGTTGLGAAIGAVADWGSGAAIGAGIGAAAGAVGVLLTRGYPTILHPETPLTFQVTAPVTFETNNAPQAFRFVEPTDYPAPQTASQQILAYPPPALPAYPYPYYVYYVPPYYRYYYPYYGYPYFYGPSFSFFFGYPGYYGYRGFYRYRPYHGYVYAPTTVPYRGGIVAHSFHDSGRH